MYRPSNSLTSTVRFAQPAGSQAKSPWSPTQRASPNTSARTTKPVKDRWKRKTFKAGFLSRSVTRNAIILWIGNFGKFDFYINLNFWQLISHCFVTCIIKYTPVNFSKKNHLCAYHSLIYGHDSCWFSTLWCHQHFNLIHLFIGWQAF